MDRQDQGKFNSMIDELARAFPCSPTRLESLRETYYKHLEEVPFHKIVRAMDLAIKTLDVFPSINKLRGLCNAHDTASDCIECKDMHRRSGHIQSLTQTLYEKSRRDIPGTIEAMYAHCRTTYDEDPRLRTEVKRAIAEMEGWPLVGKHEQTDEERAHVLREILRRGFPEPELIAVGVLAPRQSSPQAKAAAQKGNIAEMVRVVMDRATEMELQHRTRVMRPSRKIRQSETEDAIDRQAPEGDEGIQW